MYDILWFKIRNLVVQQLAFIQLSIHLGFYVEFELLFDLLWVTTCFALSYHIARHDRLDGFWS